VLHQELAMGWSLPVSNIDPETRAMADTLIQLYKGSVQAVLKTSI